MVKKTWNFDFAEADIDDGHVTVRSHIPYKKFEGSYKDITNQLQPQSKNILKELFEKKKNKELDVDSFVEEELEICFNKIAGIEGITPIVDSSVAPLAPSPTGPAPTHEGLDNFSLPRTADENIEMGVTGENELESEKYKLNILESIKYRLNRDGKIQDASIDGCVELQNNSTQDKIWGIDVELQGGENTDLEQKKFQIAEIKPNDAWVKDYKVELSEDHEPPLQITEFIDTFQDTEIACEVFILDRESEGQKTKIEIKIENTSDKKVNNIILTKEIPEDFKDLVILDGYEGETRQEN
ncbi:MAG: hypothetical protein ACTSWN_01860 [Promethearchaeota archaeon]